MTAECANCGAVVLEQYCGRCGEPLHDATPTVGALAHEIWHSISHADSRIWRTIWILLLSPGQLTRECFIGHRSRYLPPVRLYLIVSLVFFAFVSVAPQRVTTNAVPDAHQAPAQGFSVDSTNCDSIKSSLPWLQKHLLQACARNAAAGGTPVRAAFVANIPKMMFVFLPMVALVMMLLYVRQHRFYVEHIVFFLHTHAAIFLILLLQQALAWIIATLSPYRAFGDILEVAAGVYALWYMYRAMFVYYGQSRSVTLAKLVIVGFAYAAFLAVTLVATLAVSALIA